MARRRVINLDEENTDRWLVSYADFITLLFAFFVVMYSISSVNLGKYRVLSNSMTTAFNKASSQVGQPGSQLGISVQRAPISIGLEGQAGLKAMTETAAQIEKNMKEWIKKGQIAVRGNEKWLEVEISNSVLFTSGSAQLSRQASEILTSLAGAFKESNNPLYVSGYTDDLPINTVRYPSNWELSAARASSVVRLFAQAGINPARMGAIGFAEFRPSIENTSEQNRQRNRRVVIRVLAGEDMFSDSTPFADDETSATVSETVEQAIQQVRALQPAEPARDLQ